MAKKAKGSRGGARPGAGRPKVYEDMVRFGVSMPKSAADVLDALAAEESESSGKPVSRSAAIVKLLLKIKETRQAVKDGLAQ